MNNDLVRIVLEQINIYNIVNLSFEEDIYSFKLKNISNIAISVSKNKLWFECNNEILQLIKGEYFCCNAIEEYIYRIWCLCEDALELQTFSSDYILIKAIAELKNNPTRFIEEIMCDIRRINIRKKEIQ
jgi:hypothetical protein